MKNKDDERQYKNEDADIYDPSFEEREKHFRLLAWLTAIQELIRSVSIQKLGS